MSEKKWAERSIAEYLNAAASNAPAPGGGSVAALAGALGSSLVAMVGNFTVGKEKFKDVEEKVQSILNREKGIRAELSGLVQKDTEVYTLVSAAFKLPRGTDAEKVHRTEEIQKALKAALTVPRRIVELCHSAIRLSEEILKIGNPNLISDVGVAASLASAALESAWLNVEINLASIQDKAFVSETRRKIKSLLEEGKRIGAEVWKEVVARIVR